MTPKEFLAQLVPEQTMVHSLPTPAGLLTIESSPLGIHKAYYTYDMPETTATSTLPQTMVLVGTPFQCKVWQAALAIAYGTTASYQQIAQTIQHPQAHRAVATALGDNKIAYFIPCHRVVQKNGKLAGYRYGLERKEKLLQDERLVK